MTQLQSAIAKIKKLESQINELTTRYPKACIHCRDGATTNTELLTIFVEEESTSEVEELDLDSVLEYPPFEHRDSDSDIDSLN